MKTKLLLVLSILLASTSGFAQFDFGGGAAGPSTPWTEFKLNPKTRMKLDFRNANIDMVLNLFSQASNVVIVKDPALTGPITITSPNKVSLADAFEILNATLKLKNYELRKEGKLLVVRSTGRGGNSGRPGGSGQGGDMGSGATSPFSGMSPDQMRELFGGSSTLKVYKIEFANATAVARVINDVFAQLQNPFEQMMQMQMGGGNNQGGRGGQGGRFNRFGGGGGMQRGPQTVRASADDFSNSVIVNAPDNTHRQVESIIKEIDKDTEQPLKPKVYKLEYAVAQDIAPAVQNVLASNAPRGRGGMTTQNIPIEQRFQQAARLGSFNAAFGTVVADQRTNALVVTATDDNHKLLDQVIKDLDVDVKLESTTFVFPLANARADQITTLLNQAFGTRTGAGTRTNATGFGTRTNTNVPRNNTGRNNGGLGGGGFGGGGQANNGNELELALEDPNSDSGLLMTSVDVTQGGGFGQALGGNRQTTQGATGRDAQGRLVPTRDLTNQVTAIPDQNTNSIIVVTSPDNIELIRQILAQLDKIPEQVMIETIIVEATLDSSSKLGVEWNFSKTGAFGSGSLNEQGNAAFGLQTANPALQGFRYTLTGKDFNVFLNALATDQKFHVLSTPRIFTSNNAQAEINISQRVPYVLSSREDPNGNLTFTYAFEDVGIVLTVTPRITANGYVTMEISQTANDLQGFTSFNAPIINQRQANTTVSVRDGETIILGGIIRNTVSSTTKKVPLLGDLPILGNLFKSTDKQNVKTELLVFLRPRVVRDPVEAAKLREEEQKKLSKPTQDSVNKVIPKTSGPEKP